MGDWPVAHDNIGGADPRTCRDMPLVNASVGGYVEAKRLLLERGADPRTSDALSLARRYSHIYSVTRGIVTVKYGGGLALFMT